MRILVGWRTGIARGAVWCLVLGLLLTGLAGCSKGDGRGRVKRAAGSPVEPADLVGRWKMALMQFPMEVDFGIFNIEHKNKKFEVTLVGEDKEPGSAKLTVAEIKDDGQVRLEVELMGQTANFEGRLDGEGIWGTMMYPKGQLVPAKLIPTELDKLDPEQKPEYMASAADFMNAVNSADKYVALNEFVKKPESNKSPVLLEAYSRLAQHLKDEKLNSKQIREFVAEYRQAVAVWGSRMAPFVDLEVVRALAQQELELKLAAELLTTAETQITDDYPLEWKVQLADNWVRLGDPARALKTLAPLRAANPTQPFLRLVYAQAKELAKDDDAALKEYAELAILPQFEGMLAEKERGNKSLVLPSESAARLWKKKHGDSTQGLDGFLRVAYNDLMNLYVPKRTITKRQPLAQVVLAEITTGSGCSPCVPIDVAGEAVHRAFSTDELIVIRYHAHSPLPDPLANEQGMERQEYYGEKGTPQLHINGLSVPRVGGVIMQAPNLARMLGLGIEEELKKTSPVGIRLSATRAGDDITIQAAVSGIKTTDNDPRLILVLVENEIDFQALNGIRIHNGVARDFPGGTQGVKLKPGPEVEHAHTVSIPKLRAEQAAHLKLFEEKMARDFPSKPVAFKKLQVVAIVQNHITKSYMQSKLVDVTEAAPTK